MIATTNLETLRYTIVREGIVGIAGAFDPDWADRLREDFEAAFAQARQQECGAVDRGPNRWYLAVHPAQVRGFTELASHPAVTGLCESMLGPDYQFVELSFDVPLPGAADQPWHRDFPAPPETAGGRLTSLAFNLTTVDVDVDMGPVEIAPGTHWDLGRGFEDGLFPAESATSRYDERATRTCPRRGDLSARSGLTVYRGTANTSDREGAVLTLGAVCPETDTGMRFLNLTREEHEALPERVRRHVRCDATARNRSR
jgi:hypothetical protein